MENNDELKELDIESLKSVFGMEGKEKDGQFKVTVPQNDLNVMVDGFKIIPPMGLGSWAAFAPTSGKPMVNTREDAEEFSKKYNLQFFLETESNTLIFHEDLK